MEDILIQRAVNTTIQKLYDKGLFDKYANVDKVLEVLCLLQGEEVIYLRK